MIPPDPWPQPTDLLTPIANPIFGNLEKLFINKVLDSGWIGANGSFTKQVEADFSSFFSSNALLVSNGSVALSLALASLSIKPNDEVIVPNLTYAATASAVINAGAIPVVCDVELETWNISPIELEKKITKKTKAVIIVHLYGLPADMDKLQKIANKHNISVIEDSAEAFGAQYKGNFVGTIGDVGTFSFFPNKIITSGEGGLVISRNPKIYAFMKLLRGQGMSENNRYYFLKPGFNFRMTELQASILRAQFLELKSLWNARASSEQMYRDHLLEVVIESNAGYLHKRSPWIFSARIPKITIESKLKMAHSLASEGIETRPVFYPLSQMPAFSQYANADYPNSNKIATEGICLPTGSHVQPQIQKRIIDVIKEYAHHAKS